MTVLSMPVRYILYILSTVIERDLGSKYVALLCINSPFTPVDGVLLSCSNSLKVVIK